MKIKTRNKLGARVVWEVRERTPDGMWVSKVKVKNVVTSFGVNALATAPAGTYIPPLYLVINQASTTLSSGYSTGATSIVTVADPTLSGDTQLVLSVGSVNQEVVPFSLKTGTGPYTFTLSTATVNPHSLGDIVTRNPLSTDTIASITSEAQYDPTYAAGLRLLQTSSYSPGAGQNTMQFFIAGIQATNMLFAQTGLSDASAVGAGNLHNLAVLGYNHTNTNDVEIDVTWTIIGL
jgi:hypothetical protein